MDIATVICVVLLSYLIVGMCAVGVGKLLARRRKRDSKPVRAKDSDAYDAGSYPRFYE